MKSFYEHLRSSREFGEEVQNTRKPVFRSSGIFPVIKNSFYSTQILFLGYWLLKRNISEINSLVTLRDQSGNILKRNSMLITEPKSYSIDLDSMLKDNSNTDDFLGSMEVEFFSTRDMVFPFPALVLDYFNDKFNTCVHTVGRTYNNSEDLSENEQFLVPESGFDIYSNSELISFLTFVNGPKINDNGIIDYVITNHESKKFSGKFSIGKINSFETVFVKFFEYIPKLHEILNGKSGSISLKHNFSGFFPRFLVGNMQSSSHLVSITHSYYDCTSCVSKSDYWDRINDDYHDGSIYIPLFVDDNYYTDLIFYPNFSPSSLDLQIDIYDKNGNLLQEFPNFKKIDSSESKLLKLHLNDLVKDLNTDKQNILTAHVIVNSIEQKIPSRLKFGLNIGISKKEAKLPSNICFNLEPGNPQTEKKPGSFHWFPLFPIGNTVASIGNFSPMKNYSRSAQIILNFYRETDSESIERKIEIAPFNEFRFELAGDSEIKSFLQNTNGWVTVKADNPHIQGYYFNFHSSGAVAGDHVF